MNKRVGRILLILVIGVLVGFNGYSLTSDCKAYAAKDFNVYVPTDTMVAGKNYIITNVSSGNAQALSTDNEKATLGVEIATDGNIYEYDDTMVFTAGGSENAVNYFVNDGNYAVHRKDSSTNNKDILVFTTTQPTGITWSYDSTNHYLTYRSGNSTYYLYYKPNSTGETFYDRYRIKAQSTAGTEQEVFLFEETPYVEYNVTFNVVNGNWSNDTKDPITIPVSGPVGEDLVLSSDQIPEVGDKPDSHYGEGDWAPAIDTPITDENKSFTYSYSWLDHNYTEPKYTWDGYTSVDAERHCQFEGCSAMSEEQGHIEYAVTKEPSCTEPGNTTYTATFTNQVFETQTEVDKTMPAALGHTWGDPSYEWNSDNSKVTGKHTCAVCNKLEDEEVGTTSRVTQEATCELPELTTWTSAAFTKDGFEVQTKEEKTGEAIGHIWGDPSYEWNSDNSKVTGKHTCTICDKPEDEEVGTTSQVTQEATCELPEMTTWTSEAFTKDGFVVQTKTEKTGEALGHTWGDPSYEWNSDNSKVTGKHTCTVCNKLEEEEADTTSKVTEATCEDPQRTTWTSGAFTKDGFTVQTKTEATGPAKGHDPENHPATETSCAKAGNTEYYSCKNGCGKFFSDDKCENEIAKDSWVIPALPHKWDAGKVTKKATETATGEKTYTCTVCGTTKKETIPKLKPASVPSGKVTILNTIANSAKRSNDVIWDKSKVKGATNYEINWKARGASKWASKTVGNTVRGTTTGLKIKGLYDIRVRAKNAAGAGAWSNTVHRYFHTTEKIRLSSKSKGSFTINWKKNSQATGYQVMFTTNKNGSGAANNINKISKSKTSFTKKGLKSGKTYYVQIREIKKVDGVTYVGNISIPVAVKIK